MSAGSASAARLADRVLRALRRTTAMQEGARVSLHACVEPLRRGLEPLMGGEAFGVLFARAVDAARVGHPSLGSVSAERGGRLRGTSDAELHADVHVRAAEAVVRELVALLIDLVGEDLATRLVGHACTGRPVDPDGASATDEDDE